VLAAKVDNVDERLEGSISSSQTTMIPTREMMFERRINSGGGIIRTLGKRGLPIRIRQKKNESYMSK